MTVTPSEDNSPGAVPPPVRRFPEGVALTMAAVFGAAMVLAALLLGRSLWAGSSSPTEAVGTTTQTTASDGSSPSEAEPEEDDPPGEETTTSSTTSSTTAPSSSTTEGEPDLRTVACPPGTDPVICDAADFVQRTRGRPFKTFPDVALVDDAEFEAVVEAKVASAQAELTETGLALQALGLIGADQSYVDLYRSWLLLDAFGLYDPVSERLVVRGQAFDLHLQGVLIRRLTNALDDQWFDLGRETADAEAAYGFAAVVEGNGSRVERAWVQSLEPALQVEYRAQQGAAASAEELARKQSLPPAVRQLGSSPTVDGDRYVTDLLGTGEAAVDVALADPPTTSEQVLHPGLDRSTDPELVVPIPAIDGGAAAVADGRLGELTLRLWLGRVAADGWGGDRFVTWRQGGSACVRVDVGADSAADLEDLLGAAEAWAAGDEEQRTAAPITTEAGQLVRITGCA